MACLQVFEMADLEFVCIFGHDAIATPSAELEYVSDRDGGFKRAFGKVQTADPLGFRVF